MQTLLRNIRYGLRQLRNAPTFTIVAVLTLALGVGANTAIFSVIQAVLLHPAGISEPDRVASFHTRYTQLNLPSIGVSAADFKDAQSLTNLVDSAAISQESSFNTTTSNGTEHLKAATVSRDWFRVFGAQPILGRVFSPEEDQKGANYVAVLSYSAWQRIFGSQPDAVGKTIVMDGQTYRILGVMRSDFDWPRSQDLWVPLGLAPDEYSPSKRFSEQYESAVRLKPGVSVEQFNAALAQKRMEEIRREGSKGFAEVAGWSMFAQPWTKDAAGDLRKPLFALFAVVAAILLIACANVAGLLLARTAGRMRELAIRTALGASAFQITSQFLVETSLLAGAAAIIAVLIGPFVGRLLLLAIPGHLADGFTVQSNPHLVAITIGFSLLAAFLAGVAPAWQVARIQRVGEFGKSVTGSSSKQRLRSILVSTEIALAFILLAGTGMFLTSLWQLQQVDPGFRAEGVLTGGLYFSGPDYRDNAVKRAALYTLYSPASSNSREWSLLRPLRLCPFQATVPAPAASSFRRNQLDKANPDLTPLCSFIDRLSRCHADSSHAGPMVSSHGSRRDVTRGCHRRRVSPRLLAGPESCRWASANGAKTPCNGDSRCSRARAPRLSGDGRKQRSHLHPV